MATILKETDVPFQGPIPSAFYLPCGVITFLRAVGTRAIIQLLRKVVVGTSAVLAETRLIGNIYHRLAV